MRRGFIIAGGLAFFLTAGWLLEHAPAMEKLRHNLRSPVVPTGLLNYGSLGQALRQLRMVRTVKNHEDRFPVTDHYEDDPYANLFQKKRHVTPWLYAAEAFPGSAIGEQPVRPLLPPSALITNWPVISLNVRTQDLYDAKSGIVSNFFGTGREWEHPADFVFYRDGQNLMEGHTGIRLHGGKSRAPWACHSFRLHFREEYGLEQAPMDLFFPGTTGLLERLIIHADWPEMFTSCLAYDIARRIGCDTVQACPTIFYMNGEALGVYFLAEQLCQAHWARKVGHSRFHLFSYKGNNSRAAEEAYVHLYNWARDFSHPLTLEEASRQIDVTNLSQTIMSIAFGGTTDGFQGAALLDLSRPDARWRWISWDLDHSFWDIYKRGKQREAWEKEGFRLAIELPSDPNFRHWQRRGDIRSLLFTRLMTDSPEYRAFFYDFMEDQLNHRINPAFLQSRLDHYARMAESYGITNANLLPHYAAFFQHRPDFLRREIRSFFPPLGTP